MHLTFQLIYLFAEMISMEGNWEEKADVCQTIEELD